MSVSSGSSPETTLPGQPPGAVSFSVPDGLLTFEEGDLDAAAEHLVWCLRILGVAPGSTIAIQDFGASPLSFLGSALLTPGLRKGMAERLGGRVVCLDASPERVALSPMLLRQLGADVLIVRGEIAPLLADLARARGEDLTRGGETRMVLGVSDRPTAPRPPGRWDEVLLVERAMLLAPGCRTCRRFHLRSGWYRLDGTEVRNERLAWAPPHRLAGRIEAHPGGCPRSPDDALLGELVGGDP